MRVLIVDDEGPIRNLLRRFFERAGAVVDVAEDGADGLAKAHEVVPDVIVCDVLMPNMNGIEMVMVLRQNQKFEHVLIIFISGYADQYEDEARRCGHEFFLKPFRGSEVVAVAFALTNQTS